MLPRNRLARMESAPDLAHFRAVAWEAAALLGENSDWLAVMRQHNFELPG